MTAIAIGRVLGYRSGNSAALVLLRQAIRKGDRLRFVGPTTDVETTVTKPCVFYRLEQAGAMEQVCMVPTPSVQPGDIVFRLPATQERERKRLVG